MPSKRKQRPTSRKCHLGWGTYRGHTRQLPLEAFFAEYHPEFEYDATGSASHEFYRLCDELGWHRGDLDREAAHREFKNALVRQFNEIYGTDEDDLGDWQNLCHIIDMDPVPDNLDECREAIRDTHVNLVDLVDRYGTGQDVQVFESELELSEYTRKTGKYFPKENAYAGGLLQYLLRHILDPPTVGSSHRGTHMRR